MPSLRPSRRLLETGRNNMNGDTQVASLAALAPQAHPLDYHSWVHLNPGDRVIVKRSGFEPGHGTVDTVSEDAMYFWVWIDGQNRILVFHGGGTVIHKVLS
jgi:protein involved in polysaccharide export with SLBB domain